MKKINLVLTALLVCAIMLFSKVPIYAAECQHTHTKEVNVSVGNHDDKYHWNATYDIICTDCNETIGSYINEKEEHVVTKSYATAPTCLLDGYSGYQCDICKYSKRTVYPATHDISDCEIQFKDHSVKVYDMSAKDFVQEQYYDVKYDYNTQKYTITGINGFTGTLIAECPHDITENRVSGKEGYNETFHWGLGRETMCSKCGLMLSAVGGATQTHIFKDFDKKDPTCTRDGSVIKKCECGFSKVETIPATHDISSCNVSTKNNIIKVLDGNNVISSNYYETNLANDILTIKGANGYTGILRVIVPKDNSNATPTVNTNKTLKALLKTVKIKKISGKKNKIKITWKSINCKKYQIKYSVNKKSFKTILTKKNSVTVNVSKKTKKIYVRVRTYTMKGKQKIYTPWSSLKTIVLR